ncbi:hypothetical protein AMECASPLE_029363, partial [Ameca splendens]
GSWRSQVRLEESDGGRVNLFPPTPRFPHLSASAARMDPETGVNGHHRGCLSFSHSSVRVKQPDGILLGSSGLVNRYQLIMVDRWWGEWQLSSQLKLLVCLW